MTNRVDYGKILEKTLAEIDTRAEKPTLLLHACCAPCSSYTLAYLSPHFRKIDVLFYNPNISPEPEYALRLAELTHLVERVSYGCPITVIAGTYEPERFYAMARCMEELPEGGARCRLCYEMRLRETARMARPTPAAAQAARAAAGTKNRINRGRAKREAAVRASSSSGESRMTTFP